MVPPVCTSLHRGVAKQISPIYETMSKEHSSIAFAKVDVDELQVSAAAAGISAMPTFQFYKNGEKQGEVVGADVGGLNQYCIQIAD